MGKRSAAEPAAMSGDPAGDHHRQLRHFHLSGRGDASGDPLPPSTLRPAALDPDPPWRSYPLFLGDEGRPTSFYDLIEQELAEMSDDGSKAAMLGEHVARLARAVHRQIGGRPGATPLADVLDGAFAAFAAEFDLSEAGAAALRQDIDRLRERLGESGSLLALGEGTLFGLYAAAVERRRRRPLAAFHQEVEALTVQLEELLRLDDSHAPESFGPEALAAGLGGTAAFFEASALAEHLPDRRGSERLGGQRRERIEHTLESLRRYLDAAAGTVTEAPDFTVVHSGPLAGGTAFSTARLMEHPDPLGASIDIFDGQADAQADVLRAVRVARLEVEGSYRGELHDEILAGFDWRAFSADELLLTPPVAVVVTAAQLRANLASFSELLCSGRPVHVLVLESAGWPGGGRAGCFHPGLAYLAIAHREAFVLQSTLARPGHLASGLVDLAETLGPAVAIVAQLPVGPPPEEPSPAAAPVSPPSFPPGERWIQLVAAHAGRATPCLRYDPAAGTSWAERFDLEENPEPRRAWPSRSLPYLDAEGEEQNLETTFTFADFVALEPSCRGHFRVVAAEGWSEGQVAIAEYLAISDDEQRRLLPFIWVIDSPGRLLRAVLTRELAYACRDRRRAWRILQELAGTDNEHARRAAERARQETLAEAEEERAKLADAHAVELEEVRSRAAGEAMERLVAVLMDIGTTEGAGPVLPAAIPAPAPAAAAPAPAVPETPTDPQTPALDETPPTEEEAADEDEEVFLDEPWIDAPLCTTCDECTNLNPRLFKYNEDKQAYIADASAGTFYELVTAAEKCPALCIHTGAPPSGDDTVDDDLIARAEKFA
ncbi:MAG: ferredoxin [bacterium]|nr:ferredoxin [bacterium]